MGFIMFSIGFGCFALGALVGAFGVLGVSWYADKKRENEKKTVWSIDVPL